MKAEINLINVEDGDAIIIMLDDKARKSLIIIDGGYKKYYPKVKKRLEEILPKYNNCIDLLVCTHYDNDHLGGIENILDEYHRQINEIWIHKIDHSLTETTKVLEEKINRIKNPSDNLTDFRLNERDADQQNFEAERYSDLLRVVQKIKQYRLDSKVKEAVCGDFLKKFPEFSVIGPSPEFYNQNLPKLKDEMRSEFRILDEVLQTQKNLAKTDIEVLKMSNPCEALEKSSLANNVSAANMISIVTQLKLGTKKFLFTGDSGIESFEKYTANWKKDLKNLYFLVVPHHGSRNNTSKMMLKTFNPIHCFVSGKGGENRPSKNIVQCMKTRKRLRTLEITNIPAETWYLRISHLGKVQRVFEISEY